MAGPLVSLAGAREVTLYTLVGALQLGLDWLCFVLLTSFGMGAAPANLLSRLAAAGIGFLANGRITFAASVGGPLRGRPLRRFAVVWLSLTMVSTVFAAFVSATWGIEAAWKAKPAFDLLLAALQYTLSRRWIFR